MNELRLILLLVGLGIVGGLWWWEARRQRSERRQRTVFGRGTSRAQPRLGIDAEDVEDDGEGSTAADLPALRKAGPAGDPGKATPGIIAVHVRATPGRLFDVSELAAAAELAGLRYGDQRIFYHPADAGGEDPVFSMANMHEPGTLDVDGQAGQRVRGLTFFMCPPVAGGDDVALELMLHTADYMAGALGGEICGAGLEPLTEAGRLALRQKVGGG